MTSPTACHAAQRPVSGLASEAWPWAVLPIRAFPCIKHSGCLRTLSRLPLRGQLRNCRSCKHEQAHRIPVSTTGLAGGHLRRREYSSWRQRRSGAQPALQRRHADRQRSTGAVVFSRRKATATDFIRASSDLTTSAVRPWLMLPASTLPRSIGTPQPWRLQASAITGCAALEIYSRVAARVASISRERCAARCWIARASCPSSAPAAPARPTPSSRPAIAATCRCHHDVIHAGFDAGTLDRRLPSPSLRNMRPEDDNPLAPGRSPGRSSRRHGRLPPRLA